MKEVHVGGLDFSHCFLPSLCDEFSSSESCIVVFFFRIMQHFGFNTHMQSCNLLPLMTFIEFKTNKNYFYILDTPTFQERGPFMSKEQLSQCHQKCWLLLYLAYRETTAVRLPTILLLTWFIWSNRTSPSIVTYRQGRDRSVYNFEASNWKLTLFW